jgi:biotin carboxyl carrier protein
MKYVATLGDRRYEIDVEERGSVLLDGEPLTVDLQEIVHGRLYSLLLDHVSHEAFIEQVEDDDPYRAGVSYRVLLRGQLLQVQVEDERAVRLSQGLSGFVPDSGEISIRAPMPGLIVDIPVAAGQQVVEGQVLVVLESMKMDNELCAPRDGTVARLHVAAGDSVDGKQTLVTLA